MNTITINNSNIKITDNNVIQLAQDFKSYFVKTADNILEMARITTKANLELKGQRYKDFCHLIGFETQSSTLRKLIKIGEKYDLLKKNINSLPASWTTLYQISLISSDDIVKYVDVGLINPDLKSRELKSITDPSEVSTKLKIVPNRTVKKGGFEFKVVLSKQPSDKITQKIQKILNECENLDSAEVQIGSSLEEFLKPTVATV
jgi:hypothetical protein